MARMNADRWAALNMKQNDWTTQEQCEVALEMYRRGKDVERLQDIVRRLFKSRESGMSLSDMQAMAREAGDGTLSTSREHDWAMDGHDKIGNPIERCRRDGCTVRKIENCSTFWQSAKGRKWRDEEDEVIPPCGGKTS